MKKISICALAAALVIYIVPIRITAAKVIPVGQVIGLELSGLTVAAVEESARKAGVQTGDTLLSINDTPIQRPEQIQSLLDSTSGAVTLTVVRNQQSLCLTLHPQTTNQGKRLGLSLRRGITGIGTVTWYDPDTGTFGALGHGVNSGDGKLMNMTTGCAYQANVVSVRPGKQGKPGQLQGAVTNPTPIGTLSQNTAKGIFGTLDQPISGTAVEIAETDQIRTGPVKILSTVSGSTPREYDAEILKIYPVNRNPQRNLLLRITDPALLQTTGGIVQGMSGSPIIQDGKLIGAVTHVLVNDPTMGYGIFIENMLKAAG